MKNPRTPREPIGKGWMKVEVYLPNCICNGYVYCPYRRLLDVLNGISSTTTTVIEEFVSVSKAELHFPGRREAAETFCINKADILFVKPIGHDGIPLVPKQSKRVRLHLTSYILTGQIHYHRGRHWENALDSVFSFFPITNVEITLGISGIKHEAPYLAVNKEHVSSVEEIDSVKGIRI